MTHRLVVRLTPLVCWMALSSPAAFAAVQSRPALRATPAQKPNSAVPPTPAGPDASPRAKVVSYSDRDVIPVKAKLRYTTLIVLPKDEEILDFTCGDKEFWIVNGNQNFAYVKPAKEGAQTNLNLVTASGNVYSFVLSEVSGVTGAEPDLKVFVEVKDAALSASTAASPKFVSAREAEETRAQLERAQEETRHVKATSQAAIDAGIARFVTNVRFAYRFEAGKKPFSVRAMYHDDDHTYIQARPEETPALYELKDNKPNVVNFDYRDGVYVVDKVLDSGYLAIGKRRLRFTREE